MSILVIKNDGVGDLVLASGVIASIKKVSGEEVDLVVCQESVELAQRIPNVRNIIPVSRDGLSIDGLSSTGDTASKLDRASLKILRRTEYNMAFSMRRYIRESSFVLMNSIKAKKAYTAHEFLTNCDQKIGDICLGNWELIDVPDVLHESTYYQRFLKIAKSWDVEAQPNFGFDNVQQSTTTLKDGDKIAVSVSGKGIRWKDSNWFELIELLSAKYQIILLGGSNEKPLSDKIIMKYSMVETHVGELTWSETVEKLSEIDVLIAGDTGLAHLASLLCSRVIVIAGSEAPGRFFPWPQSASTQQILQTQIGCADCAGICVHPSIKFCIESIKPNDVLNALQQPSGKVANQGINEWQYDILTKSKLHTLKAYKQVKRSNLLKDREIIKLKAGFQKSITASEKKLQIANQIIKSRDETIRKLRPISLIRKTVRRLKDKTIRKLRSVPLMKKVFRQFKRAFRLK